MLIVTAADSVYFPGVRALWNSLQRNSPGHDFVCLVYGGGAEELEGIPTMDGPRVEARLPEGVHNNNDPMYCRIILPEIFDADRILWMDCDQIALKPLDDLDTIDMQGKPCGMVDTRLGITYQFKSNVPNPISNSNKAGFAGLVLIDREQWIEQKVTETCFDLMNTRTDMAFTFVVQSALNLALNGNFFGLPECYQRFANREPIPGDAKVVHWHGRPSSPWMKHKAVKNKDLWEEYA